MTTWGFIGSGNIGSTVARLATAAGDEVLMSNSRGPATLGDLVSELGPRSRAVTAQEAAAQGDIVVVTIPLKHYRQVPSAALEGKVVIDTMNYYPGRDGQFPDLDSHTTTSSEMFAEYVSGARVVKGFNNIFFQHLAGLARPTGAPDRSALPIAGDDLDAKAFVRSALDRIGYDAVDAGALAQGWRQQPDTPVYGTPYAADPGDWTAGARPAGAEVISALVAAAQR